MATTRRIKIRRMRSMVLGSTIVVHDVGAAWDDRDRVGRHNPESSAESIEQEKHRA
jgi:hypothetical protein